MSESLPTSSSTRKSKRRRQRSAMEKPTTKLASLYGVTSNQAGPIRHADVALIDRSVRHILQRVGMSDAPDFVVQTVEAAGGKLGADGRLTFPEKLIADALQGLTKGFTLHGQEPGHELHLTSKRVHVGTGGAAPSIYDLETECYRDATLKDLYDAARIVDTLDNIHFFSRSMVARDMPDMRALDINTAYASIAGTTKHVCTSISMPEHVNDIAELCFMVAGSKEKFIEKPFLSVLVNHVVSPLRFHTESCGVMLEAVKHDMPVHANTFGQMGASSPVTIAGCVAQTVAETLAGMIFAWLINPLAKVIFGTRPMITDLRTGAVTGGSGEQAKLMAATAQMADYYNLPSSTIAGATDSKIADAQSGYEKCLTVSVAANAGSNMITQACGMQAMLMGVALESYVIDNDMLGGILRSIDGIEVNDTTLALPDIDEVVHGEGHFLGQQETLHRMHSDFLYPQIADRRTIDEWEADGSPNIRDVAIEKTNAILADHFPDHIDVEVDKALREKFDIQLPRSAMAS